MKFENNQTGISLLEVLVVILLISIMMSISMPLFISRQSGRNKKIFIADFTRLVTDGARNAIMTGKSHQIFWDIDKQMINLKIFDPMIESKNKTEQFKIVTDIAQASIKIPNDFEIYHFFIDHIDAKTTDRLKTAFTYIMPDGTSQPAIINIVDNGQETNNKFSIIINPFYSQVSSSNEFIKP